MVMSNTWYNFPPLFIVHCCCQVAENFTFTSKTSDTLPLLRCFPLNATKKLLVRIVEYKLEEALFDGTRENVQVGHFFLLSVPFSQQLPRLTSFDFFSFLK